MLQKIITQTGYRDQTPHVVGIRTVFITPVRVIKLLVKKETILWTIFIQIILCIDIYGVGQQTQKTATTGISLFGTIYIGSNIVSRNT